MEKKLNYDRYVCIPYFYSYFVLRVLFSKFFCCHSPFLYVYIFVFWYGNCTHSIVLPHFFLTFLFRIQKHICSVVLWLLFNKNTLQKSKNKTHNKPNQIKTSWKMRWASTNSRIGVWQIVNGFDDQFNGIDCLAHHLIKHIYICRFSRQQESKTMFSFHFTWKFHCRLYVLRLDILFPCAFIQSHGCKYKYPQNWTQSE